MARLCLSKESEVVWEISPFLNPAEVSALVRFGVSFAHLFNGVCWFSVMPSEGVNMATTPGADEVTVV